jgi:predicted TIM-barrel fold metal-dependent hydrolase
VAPIAAVNWRDVDGAGGRAQTCLKAGFKGLFVPPEVVDGRRPGEPHFDPIWRVCEEAGVPGCLHVVVRFSGAAGPSAPGTRHGRARSSPSAWAPPAS